MARASLAFLAVASLASAQSVRPHLLVSTEWLAANLERPDVVVLHVTRDPATYARGHIPGARLLTWDQFTTVRDGVPNELPSPGELADRFARLGVGDNTRVILYGDRPGLVAARAWFTLDYLGHGEHAALLDGGLEKWRAEGRPVSQQEPPSPTPGKLTLHLRPEVVETLARIRRLVEVPDPGVLLMDTRPPEEYRGEKPAGNPPRAGHIPGAVNFYWPDALVSREIPAFKPETELRRLFESAGAQRGRRIITYCGSGVQASLVYFLARYLGYEAALYDGSISEWSRDPQNPLVTGPSPR
jgi:thiosulfate/3-mercaptopyruvate sulfurtransferase